MKAAAIAANGGIEQVSLHDLPAPNPGPGEVLIQVHAAALNHLDIWVRKGRPGANPTFPHILGSDAAGVVAALGEGVTSAQIGDEVVIDPGLSCGVCESCLRGEQSECASYTIMGLGRPGTFAEYVTVPARNLLAKPKSLSWEEAAALPLAYATAWRMLFTRAKLGAGETLLIHGIGGGVAIAALQLGRAAGAHVIVTSSAQAKLDRAKELGAHTGLLYGGGDLAKRILEATGGRGVDVIVDTVGAATWPVNIEVARKGARIAHCGVTTGATVECNISAVYWKQLSILGSTMASHEDFRLLLAAVEASGLKPVIDQVFPLAETRAAQQRMEDGGQFGKIVLKVI